LTWFIAFQDGFEEGYAFRFYAITMQNPIELSLLSRKTRLTDASIHHE
jgi:hypothetical protein